MRPEPPSTRERILMVTPATGAFLVGSLIASALQGHLLWVPLLVGATIIPAAIWGVQSLTIWWGYTRHYRDMEAQIAAFNEELDKL